jgi:pyruvyl transferase EpsO
MAMALPKERAVALLDFPKHANVGDSAIWLGELKCLEYCGIRARHIRYVCDIETYNADALRHAIGLDGVILLHGGGNFGDLWPRHQLFRESVVASFPEHQIIILPQSIYFRDRSALERAALICNAHPRLTIFVRDNVSMDMLSMQFTAKAMLCPDMAFCLGPLAPIGTASRDVVVIARTDDEAMAPDAGASPAFGPDVLVCDWPPIGSAIQWRTGGSLVRRMAARPGVTRMMGQSAVGIHRVVYAAMARERLISGCELLSKGRSIVADRLHAHILAMLLGIPHVLLDNSYGKIRRFYETWTADSTLASLADTRREAVDCARARIRRPTDLA